MARNKASCFAAELKQLSRDKLLVAQRHPQNGEAALRRQQGQAKRTKEAAASPGANPICEVHRPRHATEL